MHVEGPVGAMAPSNPVREWGDGLLILGAILLVFAVGLAAAQAVVGQVSERNYGFAALAPAGIVAALVLMGAGLVLRESVRSRRRESF